MDGNSVLVYATRVLLLVQHLELCVPRWEGLSMALAVTGDVDDDGRGLEAGTGA